SAQNLANDRTKTDHCSIGAEGNALGRSGEVDLNEGEGLREHDCCSAPLQQAPKYQHWRVTGPAAKRGGCREPYHSKNKSFLSTEDVSESPPCDKTDRIGQTITGDDQLG